MNNRNILISGASIAGPTLAYWLRQYGFNPTVIERAPALRKGGYKIDVRGAATGVLERMGILADVKAASTDMRGASFVNKANKPIVTMSADFFMGREGDDVEIMRGDLSSILYEATCKETEYIFGDSICALTQDNDGVHVAFEHGEARTFDLVVGADGLHSNVRALAFGDETAFIRYLGCYISIFSTTNYLNLDHWELFYNAPGRLANMYSAQQNKEARALFAFTSPPLQFDRRDVGAQKKLLADAFAGVGWETLRLLEAMCDAPDFYFDSMSQIQMDRWSNGRAVLIGDAGYCPSPASGQGTSLALVGAYVLAGELKATVGDYGRAYALYEQELRPYVERNLTLGQKMAKEMVPDSQTQLWFRNQMMRLLPYLPWKGLITKGILQPLREAANAITLKDYP